MYIYTVFSPAITGQNYSLYITLIIRPENCNYCHAWVWM